jgi:hypothetical protein
MSVSKVHWPRHLGKWLRYLLLEKHDLATTFVISLQRGMQTLSRSWVATYIKWSGRGCRYEYLDENEPSPA